MKTKEQILKEETVGWELFPLSSKEESDILYSCIYDAMEAYKEQELSKYEDLINRQNLLSETPDAPVTAFVELAVQPEQLEIIADPMFGLDFKTLDEYYRGKIHGQLLLQSSKSTTREDQPDFQYLFDLGVKAISMGIDGKDSSWIGYEAFEQIKGFSNIARIFWIPGSINDYDLHSLLDDLDEPDWIRILGSEKGKRIANIVDWEDYWLDVINDNELYGLIAEIHIATSDNFTFDEDGEPQSWSSHPGICRPTFVYGNNIQELYNEIKQRSEEIFNEMVEAERRKS